VTPGARTQGFSRRDFLSATSAVGAAVALGFTAVAQAEPLPEVRKIRLARTASICLSPQYVAEELLHLEGFTEVEYPEVPYTGGDELTTGRADLTMDYVPALVWKLDAGSGVVALSGVHTGCYAIVANHRIKTFSDLKGRRVAISALGAGDHVFLSSMLAYVGIDPKTEIDWIPTHSVANSMPAFADGKADALLAFPPQPQKLREMRLGHVIVDGTHDRPWSQYICCLIAGSKDFVAKNPVATKRALRAILKAADLCEQDPARAARIVVAKGFEPRYEIALEVLKGIPYGAWRGTNAEDALRFHAPRLHEAGMIQSTPQKIITQGTDWRFLNELKKELKV
jgi:NitT/TauT family transport system substrate-binding protein